MQCHPIAYKGGKSTNEIVVLFMLGLYIDVGISAILPFPRANLRYMKRWYSMLRFTGGWLHMLRKKMKRFERKKEGIFHFLKKIIRDILDI